MNRENTKRLWEKYPKIFAGKDLPITQSLIPFGFECEDGWYELIDALCDYLQFHTDHNNKPQVVATQVKEKFASLRFYVNGATPEQWAAIDFAESLSGRICERCGAWGSLKATGGNPMGWYKTLCDKCAEGTDYKDVEPLDEDEEENENA
jgi:transcription elongation factor Elf1